MTSFRFGQAYRRIISLGRLSGVPLPWYGDERPGERAAYACFDAALVLFFVYKCACALWALTHNEKVPDILFAGAQEMFCLNVPLITAYYAFSHKKFKNLTDKIDEFNQNVLKMNLGKREYFEKLYEKDSLSLTKFSKILTNMTAFCPIVTCLSNPIVGLLDGTYGTKLSVPIHCPFEENNRHIYEIIVITEFFGLIVPALQKLTNEFIMLVLLEIQKSHLLYLHEVLADIEQNVKEYQDEVKEKIVLWIKLHQATVRNGQLLVDFYAPMIVLYYFSFTGVLAGSVLFLIKSEVNNPAQAVIVGIYMSIMVFQFYIQCHMAEEVTKESQKIGDSAYRIPWYLLDKKTKKNINLIICMANQPVRIMSYNAPTFTLSKENFVSFLTSSVSAYMAFTTIMEKN
nr:olfactory receptor 1 [Tropidothorax elegans]